MAQKPHILILAAGEGTRMKSKIPKVLHPVLFQPMIHHVLELAKSIPHESLSVVVGFGKDDVKKACRSYEGIDYIHQDEQLGTGHAVLCGKNTLETANGNLIVLCGDVVLLRKPTLESLLQIHEKSQSHASFITADLPEPHGYGRIIRSAAGAAKAIREHRDCSERELTISEVNAGIYCFKLEGLFDRISKLGAQNSQNEYYLTDLIQNLAQEGLGVETLVLDEPMEMVGINHRSAIAQVQGILQKRVNEALMLSGVSIEDPGTVWVDSVSTIAPDVSIESGCRILNSKIESGVTLEAGVRLTGVSIGRDSHIKQGSYLTESIVGSQCAIGPYAQFRPGTEVEAGVKVGNFVEIKKSKLQEGSKVSHLSYLGDADIGRNVNIGCGFITCNFDGGPVKHKTIVEDGAFIGSDTQVVAPVTIGAGSYIGSGSTITKDVPPGALAVSRSRQIIKEGYTKSQQKPHK